MRHVLRACILSPNAYYGLEPCFARKQTMLAGYEDSMLFSHVRPACGRTLSRPPAVRKQTMLAGFRSPAKFEIPYTLRSKRFLL